MRGVGVNDVLPLGRHRGVSDAGDGHQNHILGRIDPGVPTVDHDVVHVELLRQTLRIDAQVEVEETFARLRVSKGRLERLLRKTSEVCQSYHNI